MDFRGTGRDLFVNIKLIIKFVLTYMLINHIFDTVPEFLKFFNKNLINNLSYVPKTTKS